MDGFTNYSGMIALVIFLVLFVLFVKYESSHDEKEINEEENKQQIIKNPLNIDDQDSTVACLVAAIDCHNETGKNVQIISVREVK